MSTYFLALLGGVMIGIATIGYLFTTGRVVGISGMIANLPSTKASEAAYFLMGIMLSAFFASALGMFDTSTIAMTDNPWQLAIAGLLVGIGTQLGSGCTSGHGVCGNARLSPRSLVATLTFILLGMMTVALVQKFT